MVKTINAVHIQAKWLFLKTCTAQYPLWHGVLSLDKKEPWQDINTITLLPELQ